MSLIHHLNKTHKTRDVSGESATVHLAAVRYARHERDSVLVVHGIDDSIIADPYPKVIAPRELHDASGLRLSGERIDRRLNPLAEPALKATILLSGSRVKADFVAGLVVYSRTSDQGRVVSRSPRTCRAARLSSR